MAKTIITAALTGAVTPAGYKIPETPQQIANEAYDAWKLGAAVVHPVSYTHLTLPTTERV